MAALILAAGRASRFGGPQSKVLAPIGGVAMVRKVALAAQAAELPIYVVTGYQAAEVRSVLEDLPAQIIENKNYMQGMSTSLQAGLAGLPDDISGVLVMLADMPNISAALVRELVSAFSATPGAAAVVPVFGGERGNPVILSRRLFAQVMQLTGDQGARKVLERAEAVLECPVSDASIRLDIDTQEAMVKISSGLPD